MAVNSLTLYLPGSSVPIQVWEGSQMHAVYVSMGANSIPSAPGETVRQDPFPQYVDDDELAAALAGVGGGGGAVDSVNGQIGVVVLDADDIGGLAAVAKTGAYSDLTGTPTIPPAYTDEQVRDLIGSTLVAGTNITKTVDDAGNTVTISATGGGSTGATGADALTQRIVSVSQLLVGIDASFPTPVRYTDRGRLGLRIRNLSATQTLQVGYGTLDSPNHASEPDAVPPGQEWVGGADPRPVFARFPTTAQTVDVVHIMGA